MSVWVQSWEVLGSAKQPYRVSLGSNGEYGCSCPAWTKNYPRKDCKHILEIKLRKVKDENLRLMQVVKEASTGVFGEPQVKAKSAKKIPEKVGERISRKFALEDF